MQLLKTCGVEVTDHEFEVKEYIDYERILCAGVKPWDYTTHQPKKEARHASKIQESN